MWSAYCTSTADTLRKNSQCRIHKCELAYCMGKKIHTHFTAFVSVFYLSSSILILIKAMLFACSSMNERKTTKYYNALSIIHFRASNQICAHTLWNRQKQTFIVVRNGRRCVLNWDVSTFFSEINSEWSRKRKQAREREREKAINFIVFSKLNWKFQASVVCEIETHKRIINSSNYLIEWKKKRLQLVHRHFNLFCWLLDSKVRVCSDFFLQIFVCFRRFSLMFIPKIAYIKQNILL